VGSEATGRAPFPFSFAIGCGDCLEVSTEAMGSKAGAVVEGAMSDRWRIYRVARILACE